ncbi:hypothetical protein [Streptomyces sp. NPDC057889]|uniref:hypothetical protein n=1 Tax=unclassified Streptomyces TaxID=2593676 RepID=UPI0036BCE33D
MTPHPAALLDVEPASYLNESLLRRFGAEPNVAYRSAGVHTIRELVGRGLACSLLMQEVRESPEGRPLKFLPITEPVGTNSLLVVYPCGIRRRGSRQRALPGQPAGGTGVRARRSPPPLNAPCARARWPAHHRDTPRRR